MTVDNLYRGVDQTDTATLADMRWQDLFSDPKLLTLIQEGLENNPDMQIALERMNEAKATLGQRKLDFLPSLSGSAGGTRKGLDGASGFQTSTSWDAALKTSWEIDVWGKLLSSKRAAMASYLETDAARRAIQTGLIAGIANSYYLLLALDEELAITQKTVKIRAEDVETMKTLKESAVVNGAAVVQSQASLYSAEVSIPDLKQAIRETENAICVLLGKPSGVIDRGILSQQIPVEELKTGIPGQLLSNRPDVLEAEFVFHQAFENVNIARTNFYPSLTITANGGLSAANLSDFFDHSLFYNLAGGLAQPIFNNGQNRANLKIAKARQEEAFIGFKKSILNAGAEVSDALFAYQTAVEKEATRAKQILALEKAVDFTKELLRYNSSTNYTDVLTSEQSLLSAQLSSVSDRLMKLQSVVNLYKALGGGWK